MLMIVTKLLGGLGTFLLAFKLLTENIEKIASDKLTKLLKKTTKNRILGVIVGTIITALLQSSTATTVMVVSFVNAGVLDLFQATSIIMGANIGTTITAHIVALDSVDIGNYLATFVGAGMILNMIFEKPKIKNLGMSLVGFGLIFIALYLMKDAMVSLQDDYRFVELLTKINNPFILLVLGASITIALQSSAAVTTILISMIASGITIGNGVLPNAPLFVILGSNIGTCLTAIVSSASASVNAKRAGLIHLLFNVFGSVIFMIILLIWKNFINDTLGRMVSDPSSQIAIFHTLFNVISTLIFLPFISQFVKISTILVKDKVNTK